ncbi:hypothetical protein KAM621c_24000 [Citrobacter braakii]|uniref:Uncharacterized protein n=1 Tax=Citrobacter braakii TaxID=57706 RepID=A0AAD1L1X6_CITBR|nr:hypothetical protein KAM621c_24000 [Citrobacter braakii]
MYLGVMSSKDWLITVGIVPVIGLAKDSNITVEMADDQISVTSGIGGDWSFVDNPTEEGSVTFVTQRNSPINTALALMQKTKAVVPVQCSRVSQQTAQITVPGLRRWNGSCCLAR